MKKLVILMVLAAAAVVLWITNSKKDGSPSANQTAKSASSMQTTNTNNQDNSFEQTDALVAGQQGLKMTGDDQDEELEGDEDDFDIEIKPAYQVYSSAEEAMEALKKGAQSYDDIVLEQFANLGAECSWCAQLFDSLKQKLTSSDATQDEKSYYAEVLAISGRLESVQFLVDTLNQGGDSQNNEVLAEALESVIGGPEVVDYLGRQLDGSSEQIKESLVAALTNHGSRQAVETLYNETVKKGDGDGYYSLGIGLGEVIPDDESIPFLVEQAKKRDQYSHLAVKSLLNSGTEGLKVVMDIVAGSDDAEGNKKLLSDAIDHVAYEESTEEYLKKLVGTTNSPTVKEFAQSILNDFQDELDEEEE